jgi:formylglycine-generating enzyme required for sulfatase activity
MPLELNFVRIPAGEFIIGSKRQADPEASEAEMPQHVLSVSEFYIMRYPVTNAQYLQFMEATGHRAPLFWVDGKYPSGQADHPVAGVNFLDAAAFCLWAVQITGLPVRLPTEPEWEKAARGPDGRVYPWGNQWEPGRCNNASGKETRDGAMPLGTTPVTKYSPQGDSPYGVADLAGNVQEWVSSLYRGYPYNPEDGREELVHRLDSLSALPRFHETGATSMVNSSEAAFDKSILRGGSWREGRFLNRCAYRSWAAPMHRSDDTGFRCCYEAA